MAVGFKFTQSDGRVTDIDDLLVRRDLFNDGSLWTWGSNGSGQLGDGTITGRSSPNTTAGGGITWKQIKVGFASSNQSLAIKTDGTLWTWGVNSSGELGDGTITNRSSPGTTAGGGTNWKTLAGGYGFSAAITTDGKLWTWGSNRYGQLGNGTGGVGVSSTSPVTTAGGGNNWKQIACGYLHSAAVKTDGTLWTWGENAQGALGNVAAGDTSSPITTTGGGTTWKQVSCGTRFTAAVKTDGTLWTWGGDAYGMLGAGTTGVSRLTPGTIAGGGTDWKQVSAGNYNGAAIKTDGTLWTWGYNSDGVLGNGTTANRSSPGTTSGGGTTWKQVEIGQTTAAIKSDGTLWTWGYNGTGALGDGTLTGRSSPVTTAGGGTNWKQVSAGTVHVAAVKDLTI